MRVRHLDPGAFALMHLLKYYRAPMPGISTRDPTTGAAKSSSQALLELRPAVVQAILSLDLAEMDEAVKGPGQEKVMTLAQDLTLSLVESLCRTGNKVTHTPYRYERKERST